MAKLAFTKLRRKWSRKEIMLLMERLELYVSAGLTVDQSLSALRDSLTPKRIASIDSIQSAIRSGGMLSRALAGFIGISATTSGLIEHGELSGNLAKAFGSARALLEREDELLKKCLSALTYPLVIGVFALLLTGGLVRGVMPQIIPMLKSLHVTLPLITRIVMGSSEFLISYGMYVCIGGAITVALTLWMYKKFSIVRSAVHGALLHMPILGNLIFSYSLSIFLYSCGSLIDNGLFVAESYSRTFAVVAFVPLKKLLESKREDVTSGIPIGKALRTRSIPGYISALLAAGESSGTLGASMIRAATILDRDIAHSLKKLTSLIEPIMMAGMGCMVGAIAISIMMPIYDISKVLQK